MVQPRLRRLVRPSVDTSLPPPLLFEAHSFLLPFLLAAERLYRKSPPSIPMLFMYRNRDCVVLGRNQVSSSFPSSSPSSPLALDRLEAHPLSLSFFVPPESLEGSQPPLTRSQRSALRSSEKWWRNCLSRSVPLSPPSPKTQPSRFVLISEPVQLTLDPFLLFWLDTGSRKHQLLHPHPQGHV